MNKLRQTVIRKQKSQIQSRVIRLFSRDYAKSYNRQRLIFSGVSIVRVLYKTEMSKSKQEDGAFSRIYKKTEFDELLIKIGGWSQFQHIQWLLLFLATVPQAWYTYAPAFAARNPKEGDIYCLDNRDIRGKEFCAAWDNRTVCQKAGYDVTYSSIVTEVCKY